MLDLGFSIGKLFGKSFLGTFEFAVAVEIFLCIFLRSQGRVKRDRDLLIGVIIQCLEGFTSLFQAIAVVLMSSP